MTDEEATKFAIQELTRMQVINGPQDVLDSHRERVKKAYPAYFDTYDRMPELVDYLDGFGNLYCVGRNGRTATTTWTTPWPPPSKPSRTSRAAKRPKTCGRSH